MHQSHQPQVQPRVAIQNVAELVGDDALQFVAGQQLQAAARDANGHVVARVSGGKGIDAALVVEHVNFRHGHPRSNGHFLDHVAQPLFIRVRGVGFNATSVQQFGHG